MVTMTISQPLTVMSVAMKKVSNGRSVEKIHPTFKKYARQYAPMKMSASDRSQAIVRIVRRTMEESYRVGAIGATYEGCGLG